MSISRRSFLKNSAAAGVAVTTSGGLLNDVLAAAPAMTPGPGNKWPGRVAINFNKNAVTFNGSNATPNTAVIAKMVDDTIKLLTGEATVGAAWKAIFPAPLTAQSKIAIKVNTLNSGLSAPHWSSVKAITDGLQQMTIDGTPFPASNITIFEGPGNKLAEAGYTATNFGSIAISNDSSRMVNDGGALNNRTYARTLSEATFLINVFSPRGHSIGSSFTLGFKSHFGTYSNPSGLHSNAAQNLRDMNCTGPVFNKTVLSVCSGIFGNREGNGPGGGPDSYLNYAKTIDPTLTNTMQPPTTIMMSTDPVSVEMQTIKMMRLNANPPGSYGVADMPTYLRASAGVTGALSGTTYNIGQIDESKMDVRRIINDTVMSERVMSREVRSGATIAVMPIKGHIGTFIEYKLPREHIGRDATIAIYDVKGALIYQSVHTVHGVLNHFSWDNRTDAGSVVSPGAYVARLTSGAVRLSTQFTLPR